jgi:hypothetical protein
MARLLLYKDCNQTSHLSVKAAGTTALPPKDVTGLISRHLKEVHHGKQAEDQGTA